jgi:hypothetical protein
MFKMKLPMGPFLGAAFILAIGGFAHAYGHQDPGDLDAHRSSSMFLVICIILSGMLVILATARMWFTHLWHDRYKNKKRRGKQR